MFAAAEDMGMLILEIYCHATFRKPTVTSYLSGNGCYWNKPCKSAEQLNFKVRGNISITVI